MNYLLAFLLPLFFSLLLTPLIIRLAVHYRAVDFPGGRKIHVQETPLWGGLAIFISLSVGLLILGLLGFLDDPKVPFKLLSAVWLACLIIVAGGIIDDKYDLPAFKQIIFPLAAALLVVYYGLTVKFVTNPLGGVLAVPEFLSISVVFIWLLAMSYTTKLLDGLDGLVSGITVIAALVIFVVSLFWDSAFSVTSLISLSLAGAYLGFLVFNWHPAKIFLGEGGSVLAGFLLGVLSILSGSKIATALLIMGIPMLDVAWVIIQRIIQGKSAIKGDNQHLHFRLLKAGFTHQKAVLLLWSLSLLFGGISLFLHTKGKLVAFGLLIFVMALLAWKLFNFQKNQN